MRSSRGSRIQGTVDEVERAILDERYFEFLLKHHGVLLEVQPLEVKRRRRRRAPQGALPPQARHRLHWPQEGAARSGSPSSRRPPTTRRSKELTFTNVPTSHTISKMLVNTGTLRLRDAGRGQTERMMDGEISLKLPFLLKPLALIGEKVIQSEGLKILDGEVPVLNRFIAEVIRPG